MIYIVCIYIYIYTYVYVYVYDIIYHILYFIYICIIYIHIHTYVYILVLAFYIFPVAICLVSCEFFLYLDYMYALDSQIDRTSNDTLKTREKNPHEFTIL